MKSLTIVSPDDMHLHVRDGASLPYVVPHSSRQFSRAIIMPNLVPPVTQVKQAIAYQQRILAAVPPGLNFLPLMALYLTETTPVSEVINAANHPDIIGFKLYPAGATTHSGAGVNSLNRIYPLFEAMQEHQVPLLCHGEVTDKDIDVFDRERVFIEQELIPIRRTFPDLRIILEHITTREAVDFILGNNENTAATITAHHLMYNRNAMFKGGIKPHLYCLPLLKRNIHQQALIRAAISGDSRFFLGTDSAPHSKSRKEQSCGCAGCYTAHAALALYVEVFEDNNALDKLEGFASKHGAAFYGLQQNQSTLTLVRKPWTCPDHYEFNNDSLIPIAASEQLNWQVEHTQQSN
ncbi:MAG: dihydroorotase [Gammaproteobacteria bacterium]|nr:dihydroorotase [Gammaproteobacteria bacterium]